MNIQIDRFDVVSGKEIIKMLDEAYADMPKRRRAHYGLFTAIIVFLFSAAALAYVFSKGIEYGVSSCGSELSIGAGSNSRFGNT